MPTTMIRDRLDESKVDPRELAAALFYTRNDLEHYEGCLCTGEDEHPY